MKTKFISLFFALTSLAASAATFVPPTATTAPIQQNITDGHLGELVTGNYSLTNGSYLYIGAGAHLVVDVDAIVSGLSSGSGNGNVSFNSDGTFSGNIVFANSVDFNGALNSNGNSLFTGNLIVDGSGGGGIDLLNINTTSFAYLNSQGYISNLTAPNGTFFAMAANGTVVAQHYNATTVNATLGSLATLNAITIGNITATGTPNSTTALFGDGHWGAVGGSTVTAGNVTSGTFGGSYTFTNTPAVGTVASNTDSSGNAASTLWVHNFYNNVTTSGNLAIISPIPIGANRVWEGDSIINGSLVGAGNTIPEQFSNLLISAGNRGTDHNVAISGLGLSGIIANYTANVHPYAPSVTGVPAFLFVWIGANDFGADPASWLSDWGNYCDNARADGFKVVAFTIIARSGVGYDGPDGLGTVPFGATFDDINKGIRRGNEHYDYLVDTASLFTDPSDTLYYIDGVHPTVAGNKKIAQMAAQALIAGQMGPFAQVPHKDGNDQIQNNGGIQTITRKNYPISHERNTPHIVYGTYHGGELGFIVGNKADETASDAGYFFWTPSGAFAGVMYAPSNFTFNGYAFDGINSYTNGTGGQGWESLGAANVTDTTFRWTTGPDLGTRTQVVSMSRNGILHFEVIGATISLKSGTNAKAGEFTLTSGNASVSNTAVTANSHIHFALKAGGENGTITAQPFLMNATAGSGFNVRAGSGDNSTYKYDITEDQ